MAISNDFLAGLSPRNVELWQAQAEFNSDNVLVVIDRPNVNPSATAAAWSYAVPFRLVGEISGNVIPFTGDIAATVADTSTAGTASVSDATPRVTMGSGTVTLSGNAAAWLATETATLTVTYTNLRGATDTDTFVVTFA